MSSCPTIPPLPGFGLPLSQNIEGLFPSALDPNVSDDSYNKRRLPALTLRELAMLKFMNQVTDKKEWEIKVFDENITQKWKSEVLGDPHLDFTDQMASYCIDELKYKAEIYRDVGFTRIFNGDVIKSDSAIPTELQSSLKSAVAPLEDVPNHKQDWHPGSDEQVLDLVHPSLFPLVYGLSRILRDDVTNMENCYDEHVNVVPAKEQLVLSKRRPN